MKNHYPYKMGFFNTKGISNRNLKSFFCFGCAIKLFY